MEKGIESYIREQFQLENVDIKTYSPLTLAYIGDGIYDLIIRTVIVGKGNAKTNDLHYKTSHVVKAQTQAKMAEKMLPFLTEEEESVFRRGRNAKSATVAKNASVTDYRKATGFEALMGFLYLSNRMDRMMELIKVGIREIHLTL